MVSENFHKRIVFYLQKYIKSTLVIPQTRFTANKNISTSFSNKNYYTTANYFNSYSYPLIGSNLSNNIYNLSTNTSDKQILSLLDSS